MRINIIDKRRVNYIINLETPGPLPIVTPCCLSRSSSLFWFSMGNGHAGGQPPPSGGAHGSTGFAAHVFGLRALGVGGVQWWTGCTANPLTQGLKYKYKTAWD